MHGMVRLVSADLHPFEIAFFRNVFGFCVLIPWLMRIGRRAFATRREGGKGGGGQAPLSG